MPAPSQRTFFVEEFDLAYPAGDTMARVLIRVFRGPQGRVVLATQPPKVEYDGPSINQAEQHLLAVLVRRFPGSFLLVQHYNGASQGMENYMPTFNQVGFSIVKGKPVVHRWDEISVPAMAAMLRLTQQEVLGM